MTMINDGTGSGKLARVDGNNRLDVAAVSKSETFAATDNADSYNVNTGLVTLTSANESAVLYLKNNEDQPLRVTNIAVGMGPSTGGTSTTIPLVTVVRNPTAGTIISSPTNVDIKSNRNYGSSKTLTADAYKGAEANTMTDGADHLLVYQNSNGRLFATIDELLNKGDSIGINITPQGSNTNMVVYAALICHLEDPNE